jgi:hypothetical protein
MGPDMDDLGTEEDLVDVVVRDRRQARIDTGDLD